MSARVLSLAEERAKREAAESSERVGLLAASLRHERIKTRVKRIFALARLADDDVAKLRAARRAGDEEAERRAAAQVDVSLDVLATELGIKEGT